MTKAQALKWATAKWGKKAALRHTPKATDAAGRAAASARLKELRANKPTLRPDWETRAEWDAHRAATIAWHKEEGECQSITLCSYRCTIGYVDWAFHVEGQGDTWAEAVAQAESRGLRG